MLRRRRVPATTTPSTRSTSMALRLFRACLYIIPAIFFVHSMFTASRGDGLVGGTGLSNMNFNILGITGTNLGFNATEVKFHRKVIRPIPFGLVRSLPFVPNHPLEADFLFNSSTGSFWLPRAPHNATPTERNHKSRMKPLIGDYLHHNSTLPHGFMYPDKIRIHMVSTFNAGDFLAVYLAPLIAGRFAEVHDVDTPLPPLEPASLAVVGSILHRDARYSWGAGFISDSDPPPTSIKEVFAVRGPVSYNQWKRVASNSTKTLPKIPKVYGDAGTLMSWFYLPHDQTPLYHLCIFPHYIQQDARFVQDLRAYWPLGRAHVLDINAPIFGLMDELVRCDFVLSSTLHGIIFADSYGIPNAHYRQSNQVAGGFHKFDDYYQSIDRPRSSLQVPAEPIPGFFSWEGEADADGEPKPWTPREVLENVIPFVDSQRKAYQKWSSSARIDRYDYWAACPMHAEAYGRTRKNQTQFAMAYAQSFVESLRNRPQHFFDFQYGVQNATAKLLQEKP